ncbi:MAG: hypothetical protein XD76_0397 [candidate division TA06 bacterium 32_111]|uniref:Uncharacterized protein n=1 Tax=candidate division TA06 bacterium 34_109 TaxID=1635277 RepID=A0A101I041_UNCT6|nr:MAG: hypothetical protein XD76_0397 [candidate division TA06 bacterium 32_111]KUK86582.1 MAG: hypothetical protein XE03_1371 [candidate division TA06 bacterium 34_109]
MFKLKKCSVRLQSDNKTKTIHLKMEDKEYLQKARKIFEKIEAKL